MDVIADILDSASKLNRHIILVGGTDLRVIQAAGDIVKKGVARITLLGNPDEVRKLAEQTGTDLEGVNIINHMESDEFESYSKSYCELRKKKGLSMEVARRIMADPVFYAAMMVREGFADGAVAGAISSTGNVIKAALHIIKTSQEGRTLSGYFIMVHKNKDFGHNGVLLFADCAVVPEPTSEQLVEIAAETARNFRALIRAEPHVAFLNFSTKGSAKGAPVQKISDAARMMADKHPEIISDGELQFDAALVKDVARSKAPESPVAGRANVFIFPNLDAGNIGYKIAERLGDMIAVGPLFQGLAKPMNDLSRGCCIEEIIAVTAITALQTTVSE